MTGLDLKFEVFQREFILVSNTNCCHLILKDLRLTRFCFHTFTNLGTGISASSISIPNVLDTQTLGDAGVVDGLNITVVITTDSML